MNSYFILAVLILGYIMTGCSSDINGCVKDLMGRPIDGVQVKIKDSQLITQTGKDGKYKLEYKPGNFSVLYSKEGYSKHEKTFNLTSKESFPIEDVNLYKLSNLPGIYYYNSQSAPKPIYQRKIFLAGTFMQSVAGVKEDLAFYFVPNNMPTFLVYGKDYVSNNILLDQLKFIERFDAQNIIGRTPVEANLWKSVRDVGISITSISAEEIASIVKVKSPLQPGVYALNWGGLRTNNPIDSMGMRNMAFPFEIGDELTTAIFKNDMNNVKIIIERNKDIINKGSIVGGVTPLHASIREGNIDILRYLIENGADINAATKRGITVLMAAAFDGNLDAIKVLLGYKNKIDINKERINGFTALHSACEAGHIEIVKVLLENGAQIKKGGITPLEVAELYKRSEIVNFLEKYVKTEKEKTAK